MVSSIVLNPTERPQFLNNLKYGNLYVFHHPGSPLMYRRPIHEDILIAERFIGMPIVMVELDDIEPSDVYVAARRFNLSNVGEEAVTWARFNVTEQMIDTALTMLKSQLLDLDNDTSGDNTVTALTSLFSRNIRRSIRRSNWDSIESPNISSFEIASTPMPADTPAEKKQKRRLHDEGILRMRMAKRETPAEVIDTEELQEEAKLKKLEARRQRDLAKLQAIILDYITTYHEDPSPLISQHLKGKYILKPGKENLSRLVVNGDLQIVLPDWDEKVLPMHALARSLYILFLRHPEGIVLKNIGNHCQELLEIYNIVKPGRDEELAVRTIVKLTMPLSDTLIQNLSRIKRAVKTVILDEDTACQYYITGQHSEPYRIALPRHLVTLPAIFASEEP